MDTLEIWEWKGGEDKTYNVKSTYDILNQSNVGDVQLDLDEL